MSDGYNFEQLRDAILSMSKAQDWEIARKEWRLVAVWEADEPDTCLCGHRPIVQICTIVNDTTRRRADVGNVCIKRFFGIRSDLIFAALKRVREDISRPLNADAVVFFHRQGVISDWEYNFLQDTKRKRVPSIKQAARRADINEKVLRSAVRPR